MVYHCDIRLITFYNVGQESCVRGDIFLELLVHAL